jgi:hypothetical protein
MRRLPKVASETALRCLSVLAGTDFKTYIDGPVALEYRDGDANNAILAAVGYNFSLLLRWLRFLLRLILAALSEHLAPAAKAAAA